MIKGLRGATIWSEDLNNLLPFYRDLLGFDITFRGPTPEDGFFGKGDGLRGFVIEDLDGYGLYFGRVSG